MGMLGSANISPQGIVFTWGTLQTIGLSGLLLFPVISLPKLSRLVIAGGLILIYQVMLEFSITIEGAPMVISDVIYVSANGGILGTISFGALIIVASVSGQWFWEQKYRSMIIAGSLLLLVGIGLHYLIPFSKHRVSVSYIVFSGGVCILFLLALWGIYERFKITRGSSSIFQPLW